MPVPIEIPDAVLSEALSYLRSAAGDAYLVGGAVRDLLLGRTPRDLDVLVTGDVPGLAQLMEKASRCKAIVLGRGPAVVRLVWAGGAQILDLLELAGTLEQDLARRDCTVNAMALRLSAAPSGLTGELHDPLGGMADLRARRLRMTSEQALVEDPVRVLRVFRLAAQLGFRLEGATVAAIERHAATVVHAAPERVQEELLLLLDSNPCYEPLCACAQTGVLLNVIPELAALKEVRQDGFHHLDAFDHSLETVRAAEDLLLGEAPPLEPQSLAQARAALQRPYLAGASDAALLKLAALLHDIGKPPTVTADERGTHFYRHNVVGEQMASEVARRLRFSREAERRLALLVREHLRPGSLADLQPRSERAVNRFFRRLGQEAVPALLLGVADRMAARGPAATADWLLRQVEFANAALAEYFRRAQAPHNPPLLDGHQVMARYHLQPGRLVGRALALLRRAQEEGRLHTREEAEAFLDEQMPRLQRDIGGR